VLVMMAAQVWALQTTPQAPTAQKTGVAKKKQAPLKKVHAVAPAPIQQLPPQIMPPVPATLMNSAPVKPSVTMEQGLLTIDAPNSTLSDVLSGVHKATGASIEGASPTERVAVKLGPGKPEQVIAALLRGTPYDYVILGSLSKQSAVTRVLLTQQSASGPEPTQADSHRPQPAYQPPPDETAVPDQAPVPDDSGITQPAANAEPEQTQPPQQPAQQDQNQNQPKTPDQLFKELQQLEQQKQPPTN
jgi:hypothetical protein